MAAEKNRPKVLLIDDSPEDRAAVRFYLQDHYQILEAESGARGLALCRARRPDCLILNSQLTDMNGSEILEALQPEIASHDLAIVVITTTVGENASAVEAMKKGAHDYLAKDGDGLKGLRRAVENALEKTRLQRELSDSAERYRRIEERMLQLAESQKRLRVLVADLTVAEERERRRFAAELHDHLTQLLVVSRMGVMRAKQLARDPKLLEALRDTDAVLNESLNATRTLMAELSPRVLYELGLPAALRWLGERMRRHGLTVEVNSEGNGLILQEQQLILMFQCVRELLWNVVKHASVDTATLSYTLSDRELTVVVADDGKGFDPELLLYGNTTGGPFGLFSVRERLELEGGRLELATASGRGTRVTVTLPIIRPAAKELAKTA